MPTDYSRPFQITGPAGNNALSYARRGASPSLWVPSIIDGTIDDVAVGDQVVFEDFDEHDVLQSCTGLAHLVRMDWDGIPVVVMDNHNHAFYFWAEAIEAGRVDRGATLIHVDQHRDMRVPERGYTGTALEDAFAYTNFHLNVGNYIVPARRAGMIGETQMVTSEDALNDSTFVSNRHKILNIDLDFFAPEMAYVNEALATRFLAAHFGSASLVTIATSPFFIDQARAIGKLRELSSALRRKT